MLLPAAVRVNRCASGGCRQAGKLIGADNSLMKNTPRSVLFIVKNALLLLVFAALAGCSSAPKKQVVNFWGKDGMSYESAVSVEAECRHDALGKVVASSQELNMVAIEERLVDTCMKSQGFRMTKYEKE